MEYNLAYYKGKLVDLQITLKMNYTPEYRQQLKRAMRHAIRKIELIEREVLCGSKGL